jgi:tripartite-type tricarboxylate transporter receptor subunit TctC
MVPITYKGSGQTVNALVSGEVQVHFPGVAAALPFVKVGKLRALGVTTREPSAQMPDVPPLRTVYPEFNSASVHGLFAAVNTPQPIVSRIYEEFVKALHEPAVKGALLKMGVDPVGGNGEQLIAQMRSEMRTTGKLIKDKGLKGS